MEKALGSYDGSAFGNSEFFPQQFPGSSLQQELAIILDTGKEVPRGWEEPGDEVGDRRQLLRGGFYSPETWVRGMTNGVRL